MRELCLIQKNSPLKIKSRLLDSAQSCGVFVCDISRGLTHIGHHSLALMGLVLIGVVLFAAQHTPLRSSVEKNLLGWLQIRHETRLAETAGPLRGLTEPNAVARATAIDPQALSKEQSLIAYWLSKRYHVAPEPISRLVKEAWSVGRKANLEPTLILAVMAIESSFNPFAQSKVGAQGLMQVMTELHDEKYEPFGGNHAAFDPVTNLRVGALVLKECIARAGSIETGLKFYVGAANLPSDGGYAWKVLSEQEHMRSVLAGRTVAFNAPLNAAPTLAPASSKLKPLAASSEYRAMQPNETTAEKLALLQ
jgi:hypothetical protein